MEEQGIIGNALVHAIGGYTVQKPYKACWSLLNLEYIQIPGSIEQDRWNH